MKHWFILNPSAGRRRTAALEEGIHAACRGSGVDYEIHETRFPGEGEAFVRARRLEPGARCFACGGDGTLNEVVNGVVGEGAGGGSVLPDADGLPGAGGAAELPGVGAAEIGCIPMGTGNDFVRNFTGRDFRDLTAQIRGESVPCDLIAYEAACGERTLSRFCVNMFNIGFDCNVVDTTDRIKKLPLVGGTPAYLASIAFMLVRKKGANLRIRNGDGFTYEGKLLLLAVANGCFCGGGIKGMPRARTDDGCMDVSLIRDVPRRMFVQLFPKYMKGTHLEEPRLKEIIRYTKEKAMEVAPLDGTMRVCVDGEVMSAEGIRMEIRPKAFRFILPGAEQFTSPGAESY